MPPAAPLQSTVSDSLQRQRMETVRQQLLDRVQKGGEIAQTYTVVVIFGAYAGLFTIWAYTKEHMGINTTYWVAALLGSSMMVFVAFEVFKIAANGQFMLKISALVKTEHTPAEFFALHQKLVKDQLAFQQMVLVPIWLAALFITVVTGFGAAAILMGEFVGAIASGKI